MKAIRKSAFVVALLAVIAVFAVPTFAQDNPPAQPSTSRTITITQQQINDRLAKMNRPRVSNAKVTLGNGDISATFTLTDKDKKTYDIAVDVTPSVKDGRIVWTLNSLTVNGQKATDQQTTRAKQLVQAFVGARLQLFGRANRRVQVASITVTPDAITIVLTRQPRGVHV